MKITNIHQRKYQQPPSVLSEILATLSSKNDRLWPHELWPPMVLNNGLKLHSSGGHGPIGYYVSDHDPGKSVEFTFTKPEGFAGTHSFELIAIGDEKTLLRHTIDMDLSPKGMITWYVAIKWLHDALLEDCLDKVHNQVAQNEVRSRHNLWVTILRKVLKRRRKTV
ncbi:MAG: hypothetical protein OEL83_14535 [Desulforhopalus sp.]|nr:hypothetical protein [Desulforhopalus sp.]